MKPFGMRAMMSLRLEKWFGSWMREFRPDYTPAETGLDRFISWKKNDFIGRDAALKARENPPNRKLTTFIVDAADADVVAWEPIFDGDTVLGFCTSGGYAHWAGKSCALGLLPRERAVDGAEFTIEILGERRQAVVHTAPLFDPDHSRMRG
jgi:dimethylglycine dehydrogenase